MKFNLKKVIASVAALAMSLSCFTAFAADFSDVEATASYKNAIDTLVALEVVNGYEDGTFKPEAEITRAEVTKMVVAAMGPSYTAAAESSVGASEFADVKGHWAAGYISVGVAQKFINGMGDGTFAPDANVTYAQIVKMLVAALGYESAAAIAGGYPNGYLQTGNQIGVTAGVAGVSADTNVTRAQVAQLIANAVDVPLVVVTNWTTNILTGEPVAETEIMDGTEGKKYQTLLTEYHDTYKVKGRVTGTHAMGVAEVGMVQFDVEYADNFDGDYIDEKKYGNTTSVEAYVGDTAAEDLLFTYAEALIAIDADDEAHIISIFPYGKNDVFTFSADDFAGDYVEANETASPSPIAENVTNFTAPIAPVASGTAGADGSIAFYTTAGSSKTKTYEIAKDAKFYVNGYRAAFSFINMKNFIIDNKIGTVTLIDAPAAGSTSKDGKIDIITVDVAKWAIVETAMLEGDEIAIYLKDFESNFVDTPIVIDLEDEDLIYSIVKDGVDIEYTDLKEDDVLLVKYNVVANARSASASNFIDIIVSDKVVEGQVAGIKTVDGIPVYTIAGEEYKSIAGALTAGNDYKALLDAAGRIVYFEELATTANYAVIDRVYKDNNTDEFKIRLMKADGTREAYVAKDAAIKTAAATLAYGSDVLDGGLRALNARVVKYKTNAAGEINQIALCNDLGTISTATEFNENSTKVGAARMSASTQILDLTAVVTKGDTSTANYTAADIKAGALTSFIDGENYKVIYGDKAADGTYRFVIITEGNATINAATAFAVIDNVSTGIGEDGSTIAVLNAFTADETGVVALNVDEDVDLTNMVDTDGDTVKELSSQDLPHGAVVVLGFNAAGAVETIVGPIYTVANVPATIWSGMNRSNDPMGTNFYYANSGVPKWNSSVITDNNWARVGFGIITDKVGQTLSIASRDAVDTTPSTGADADITAIVGSGSTFKIQTGAVITRANEVDELSVASDVNVYVYDYGKKAGANVSKGSYGNVVKTFVSTQDIVQNGGEDIIDWTAFDRAGKTPNYAFYKVTNDEITDIIVIKPAV